MKQLSPNSARRAGSGVIGRGRGSNSPRALGAGSSRGAPSSPRSFQQNRKISMDSGMDRDSSGVQDFIRVAVPHSTPLSLVVKKEKSVGSVVQQCLLLLQQKNVPGYNQPVDCYGFVDIKEGLFFRNEEKLKHYFKDTKQKSMPRPAKTRGPCHRVIPPPPPRVHSGPQEQKSQLPAYDGSKSTPLRLARTITSPAGSASLAAYKTTPRHLEVMIVRIPVSNGMYDPSTDETPHVLSGSVEQQIEKLKVQNRYLQQKLDKYERKRRVATQVSLADMLENGDVNDLDLDEDDDGRGFALELEFGQDSPFYRNDLEAIEARVRSMGVHLKYVTSVGQDFLNEAKKFGNSCEALAGALSEEWKDVETNQHGNMVNVSLGEALKRLGTFLYEVKGIQDRLVFACENLFMAPLNSYRERHHKLVKDRAKSLKKMSDDYEAALMKFLCQKRLKDPTVKRGHSRSHSAITVSVVGAARKQSYRPPHFDEQFQTFAQLKKNYETTRFDHIEHLNTIMLKERMILIESVCAAHVAFKSYFHEGHDLAEQLDEYVRTHQKTVAQKLSHYQTKAMSWRESRIHLLADVDGLISSEEIEMERDRSPSIRRAPSIVLQENNRHNITHEGYLLKLSSSVKKDWKRRWFVLKDGDLCYYRSAKDLEPEKVVNVLLSTVRIPSNAEIRNTFEIISPKKRCYLLQAESARDLHQWVQCIQNCTEHMLTSHTDASHRKTVTVTAQEKNSRMELIRTLKDLNRSCADCGTSNPEWISINLGVMMCIECSGIHRSMGTHITKVRSVTLDKLDAELLALLACLGNQTVNDLFEHTIPDFVTKPDSTSSREEKEEFIRSKYDQKMFLNRTLMNQVAHSADAVSQLLFDASKSNNIGEMMAAFAFNADPNWHNSLHNGYTSLHVAAQNNSCRVVEYLMQNGARTDIKSSEGLTVVAVAELYSSEDVIKHIKGNH